MSKLILEEETYKILGLCMEVHNHTVRGMSEVVYKDALELEFQDNYIIFEREKKYVVNYKGRILKHKFYADFVVFDEVILEVKSTNSITDEFIAQCINYLKVSGKKVALLVNFGESKLVYKRIVV